MDRVRTIFLYVSTLTGETVVYLRSAEQSQSSVYAAADQEELPAAQSKNGEDGAGCVKRNSVIAYLVMFPLKRKNAAQLLEVTF